MMNPGWMTEEIRSRDDFVLFLERLADSFQRDDFHWENSTIEGFLRAWAAWASDMDGYFMNRGEPVPSAPSWELVAQMLLAARVYE